MESEADFAIENLDLPDYVLEWTASVTLPEFGNKRGRPPDKHPILKQLLEAETDDSKHANYTAHVLIQRQARKYAFAVEDVLRVLKNATKCINESHAFWRGGDCKEQLCPPRPKANQNSSKNEGDLTRFGSKIVEISEALKHIQEENALSFWTSQQRVMILQQLVSFSRDAVKLRRKLARIKGNLEDRVRNVRRIAIKCECEITGNLVPSEIYYQWVKEDSTLYKDNLCNTAHVSQQNLSKVKSKVSSMKKAARSLMSCVQPSDLHELSISDSESLTSAHSSMHKVYQIDKHVEIIHKVCGKGRENTSVADGSIINILSLPKAPTTRNDCEREATPQLEDAWAPKPSQKYLETIASNCTPPQKFNTYGYIYDHCESRIRETSEDACPPEQISAEERYNQNHVHSMPSNLSILEDQFDEISVAHKEIISLPLTSEELNDNSFPATLSPPSQPPTVNKLLNDAIEQQLEKIANARNKMHDVVTRITYAVRNMEREWVSPETMLKSKASGKEFFQLIDFIVEIAKLTEDPEFASRLYPEDRDEIVSVLDPVLRELTNCFMSLHLLHNLVAVDVQYLKELLVGYPKGSLVIRDWVSHPSIDEGLCEMEQPNAATDLDVDVDELFD